MKPIPILLSYSILVYTEPIQIFFSYSILGYIDSKIYSDTLILFYSSA